MNMMAWGGHGEDHVRRPFKLRHVCPSVYPSQSDDTAGNTDFLLVDIATGKVRVRVRVVVMIEDAQLSTLRVSALTRREDTKSKIRGETTSPLEG